MARLVMHAPQLRRISDWFSLLHLLIFISVWEMVKRTLVIVNYRIKIGSQMKFSSDNN